MELCDICKKEVTILTREVWDYKDPDLKEVVQKTLCKPHKLELDKYYATVILDTFGRMWRDWFKEKQAAVGATPPEIVPPTQK